MLSQEKSMVWVWNWNYGKWTLKAIKRQKSSSRIRAELFWDNLAASAAGLLRLFLLHLLQTKRAQSWRTSSSCHFSLSDIMEGLNGMIGVGSFHMNMPPPSSSPPILLVPPLLRRTHLPRLEWFLLGPLSRWQWMDGWMDPHPSNPSLSPLTLPHPCTASPLYTLLYFKGVSAKYTAGKVRMFLQSGAVLAGPHNFKVCFQTCVSERSSVSACVWVCVWA